MIRRTWKPVNSEGYMTTVSMKIDLNYPDLDTLVEQLIQAQDLAKETILEGKKVNVYFSGDSEQFEYELTVSWQVETNQADIDSIEAENRRLRAAERARLERQLAALRGEEG